MVSRARRHTGEKIGGVSLFATTGEVDCPEGGVSLAENQSVNNEAPKICCTIINIAFARRVCVYCGVYFTLCLILVSSEGPSRHAKDRVVWLVCNVSIFCPLPPTCVWVVLIRRMMICRRACLVAPGVGVSAIGSCDVNVKQKQFNQR